MSMGKTEDIIAKITIPKPYTVKNSKFRCDDDKTEASRLFKSLKSKLMSKNDLTEYGRELVMKYYPITRPKK